MQTHISDKNNNQNDNDNKKNNDNDNDKDNIDMSTCEHTSVTDTRAMSFAGRYYWNVTLILTHYIMCI